MFARMAPRYRAVEQALRNLLFRALVGRHRSKNIAPVENPEKLQCGLMT